MAEENSSVDEIESDDNSSPRGQKEKQKKWKRKDFCSPFILVKHPDLVWCLHDDFGRALILQDDANDVDRSTRIKELRRHCKLREV